jgi:hypothetical protein
MTNAGWHEEMAGHLIDGVQHREILDTLVAEKLDQALPGSTILVLGYGCCHHSSADANIA